MDSERSPSLSDAEDEPTFVTRDPTSCRLSFQDPCAPEHGEDPIVRDPGAPFESLFDGDDIVVAIVDDVIGSSVAQSLETFYNARLVGYVAGSVTRSMLEAVAPVFATREFSFLRRDSLEDAVFPSASRAVESKPSRSDIDSFSRSEIPVRHWRRPSEIYYGSPTSSRHSSPSHTPRSMGKGERHDSPAASRPSSLGSFNQHKKKAHAFGHVGTTHNTANPGSVESAIPPGVVFSTVPPEDSPRCSPRKVVTLLRNARRLSTASPKVEPPAPLEEAARAGAGAAGIDAQSTGEREPTASEDDETASSRHRRRFSIDLMNPQVPGAPLAGGDSENASAPVEVEYSIKRQSPGRRSSKTILPDLATHFATADSTALLGGADSSASADEKQFVVDPMSQGFQGMIMSPGVKLLSGETMKLGPDLPLFATRMRKSTFYQVDALSVSATSSTQSLNTTKQLPDTPRRLLMTLDRIECEEEEHKAQDDVMNPATAVVNRASLDVEAVKQSSSRNTDTTRSSVSKKSSTGPLFFKRQSKVVRPCVLTGGRRCQQHNHCDGVLSSTPGSSWAVPAAFETATRSEHERDASAPQENAFRDLAKQRAFHRKMSTVVSPTRRSSSIPAQTTTSYRPTTVAVSSPLARRKLVVKAPRDSSGPLDRVI